ncbi:hypothetical protein SAMN04489807_3453 [Microbacterium hydrocarbonoxydans]|uniref:Uncharacterized protein n=1 Tax=Microbacterium hydrocarbonoxydans TaxID=273678 RepID=A0A1H4T4G8_9MICO|nr:hypothetical protein SAMN04489807_3453 [Microbacterium hydrocarbonoxydans]
MDAGDDGCRDRTGRGIRCADCGDYSAAGAGGAGGGGVVGVDFRVVGAVAEATPSPMPRPTAWPWMIEARSSPVAELTLSNTDFSALALSAPTTFERRPRSSRR